MHSSYLPSQLRYLNLLLCTEDWLRFFSKLCRKVVKCRDLGAGCPWFLHPPIPGEGPGFLLSVFSLQNMIVQLNLSTLGQLGIST